MDTTHAARRVALVFVSGLAAILCAWPPVADAADFYKWVDGEGNVHFADSPSEIPSRYREQATGGKFKPVGRSTVMDNTEGANYSFIDEKPKDTAQSHEAPAMSAAVKLYNDANFEKAALKSGKLTVVEFWATWCGPCRRIAPVIDLLAGEFTGKVDIGKLDIDANRATTGKYGVKSIPTMIFFKNGAPVHQVTGVVPLDNLRRMIQERI
ncbi:MAG: thioredoxin [Nitrospinae bacterium]|nr:thioredoxin [Nitrospinota bacterium]